MTMQYSSISGVTSWRGDPTQKDVKSDGQNYVYFLPENETHKLCVWPYCGIIEIWQKVTHKRKFLGITIATKTSIDLIAAFKIKKK